ncbi:hypothetical protein TNCV_1954341 [Trichonephila clavipes]|nr:hypothetical protein TNCV_1954341 [Trichonephila clavipes]
MHIGRIQFLYAIRPISRVAPVFIRLLSLSLYHRPDTVALYSGCTPGKRRAWFLPDDRHTASLVGLCGGWRHTRTKLHYTLMDPMLLVPADAVLKPEPSTPIPNDALSKNMSTPIESFISTSLSNSNIQPPSISNTVRDSKQNSKIQDTSEEEDMITYDVEEDDLETHPDLMEKIGKQYWRGSSLLNPTREMEKKISQ